jgi:putative hydrolase of the HAD superfamily
MIELIAFDADDTLWHNEILYVRAKDSLARLLAKYTGPVEIEQALDQMEAVNLEDYGYGIKSFTLSMIEAAIKVGQGKLSPTEVQSVMEIGRAMHRAPVELFAYTQDTLTRLMKNFDLMLLTKGEPHEQLRKVARSGLRDYFKYIEVVGEKAVDDYRLLLEHHRVDPAHFVMVGNSMRSDILPVIEIGGTAVYIPYEHTWTHEQAGTLGEGTERLYEVANLGLVPALIERISKIE